MELEGRFRFFIVVTVGAILSFLFRMLLELVLDSFQLGGMSYLILFYGLFAMTTILAGTLALQFLTKFITRSSPSTSDGSLSLSDHSQQSIHSSDYKLFQGFSLQNFPKQVRSAVVLLTVIYVPIDLLSYLLPNVLDNSAIILSALDASNPQNYFLYDFPSVLISIVLVHFAVSLREEFLFREFFLIVGQKEVHKNTAFVFSALLFGLAHFDWFFSPQSTNIPVWFFLLWGLNAMIIGFVSATFFTTTKQIWPLILAHFGNNVISSLVIRNYALGKSFWEVSFLQIYLPLLIIGISASFLSYKSIGGFIKRGFTYLKNYRQENPGNKMLVIDIVFIGLLWIVTIIF
ncbi:MAG: lysostaphin resistance A-like protein [Promethearchaeota archaeon]